MVEEDHGLDIVRKVLAFSLAVCCLSVATSAQNPAIITSDVERFFVAYDRHSGVLDAPTLEREYLEPGTPGLKEFARLRRVSAESIARRLATDPSLYSNARNCAVRIPAIRARLGQALKRLNQSYPEAKMPPVHIVVGHGKPVGVGNPTGVYIGLEALCDWTVPNPYIEDRFVHVIAHEYVHVQQPHAGQDEEQESVLVAALAEGGAEFVGELISGSVAYAHLPAATRGNELAIEAEFRQDMEERAIGSKWVYNGLGTRDAPGDLGYWVGYRICKAYYLNATDKRQALRDIIELKDPNAILNSSGWSPGVSLPNAETQAGGRQ
jgi:hypothetical protein